LSPPDGDDLRNKPPYIIKMEFDMMNPDGASACHLALEAPKMKTALWDVDNWLRDCIKYGHTFKDADEALRETRAQFHKILEEHRTPLE